jgi:hypothetical protein
VPCPVFASFILAFALQLRKKHGKTSVRVIKTSVIVHYTYYQNTHYKNTYIHIHTHTHTHTHIQGKKVKVKCTLVQALRLCTGRTAHRGSRGIALLFLGQRHWKGVRGQRHAPAALYPREKPDTHCTGGWGAPRAGLDRCGKSRPLWDSIPGLSSP